MKKRSINSFGQAAIMALMLSQGVSAPAQADATVNFHGTLRADSGGCKVNNNQPVSVEFGTVEVDKLSAAQTTLSLAVVCTGSVSLSNMTLAIDGDRSSFSSDALKASIDGLGITLSPQAGAFMGTYINITTPYPINSLGLTSTTGTIDLTAGLISDGTTTLKGGEFTATATLVLKPA